MLFDDRRQHSSDIYRFCRDLVGIGFTAVTNHDWGPNMTDVGCNKRDNKWI